MLLPQKVGLREPRIEKRMCGHVEVIVFRLQTDHRRVTIWRAFDLVRGQVVPIGVSGSAFRISLASGVTFKTAAMEVYS